MGCFLFVFWDGFDYSITKSMEEAQLLKYIYIWVLFIN